VEAYTQYGVRTYKWVCAMLMKLMRKNVRLNMGISNKVKAGTIVFLIVLLFGISAIVSVRVFEIVFMTTFFSLFILLCCKVLYDVILFGLNKK
jgi:hypothetical protein